jgi:Flp pilus assembly protein TadD
MLARMASRLKLEPERADAVRHLVDAAVRTSGDRDAVDIVISGITAEQAGDARSAMELHAEAVRNRPESPLAWHALGVTMHRYRHYDFAQQCYQFALRLDVNMTVSRFARGFAFVAMDRPDAARRDWTAVLAGGPGTLADSARKWIAHLTDRPGEVVSMATAPSVLRSLPYET